MTLCGVIFVESLTASFLNNIRNQELLDSEVRGGTFHKCRMVRLYTVERSALSSCNALVQNGKH